MSASALIEPLSNLAAWSWQTSLQCLVPALLVLALCYWRDFPVRWRLCLIGLLFVRFLLPTVPGVSWLPSLGISPVMEVSSNVVGGGVALPESGAIGAMPATATMVMEAPASSSWDTTSVLGLVWFLGFATVLGWVISTHVHLSAWVTRRRAKLDPHLLSLLEESLRRSSHRQVVSLVAVQGASTVAVWGAWRPRIIVPADLAQRYSDDEIIGMFLHEVAHIRRRDVLWNWAALTACALHWFNPFSWWLLRRFQADRELACDSFALGRLPEPERPAYGRALLKTMEQHLPHASPVLVPFFHRKPELRTRILMITHPHQSMAARLAAILIVPTLAFVSLTRATKAAEREDEGKARSAEAREGATAPREGQEGRAEGNVRGGKREIVLQVGPDGAVVHQGTVIPLDELESKLKTVARLDKDQAVILRGDDSTPYAKVMKVLEVCKNAGIWNVAFATGEAGEKFAVTNDRDGKVGDLNRIKEGDGDGRKNGQRDGDGAKAGARDGDGQKSGPRDGEAKKSGPRDGEGKAAREGDGDGKRAKGDRDGEGTRTGPRDGETKKTGPRDGEMKRTGPRDGEGKAAREGDGDGDGDGARAKDGERDGDGAKKEKD